MPTLTVDVTYFALLREQRGLAEERLHSDARTALELYESLRETHGFSLRQDQVRVAVNDEFAEWDQPLASGDRVVFIPPVAGG